MISAEKNTTEFDSAATNAKTDGTTKTGQQALSMRLESTQLKKWPAATMPQDGTRTDGAMMIQEWVEGQREKS